VQVTDSPQSAGVEEALFKRMAEEKLPIFAFGAGSQKALPDVAVREVLYDGFAFVHNRIGIEARFSSRGLAAHKATVRLTSGGAVIQAQEIELPQNGEAQTTFNFTPDRVGRFIYGIDISTPSGDAVPDNNSRSFSINSCATKTPCTLPGSRLRRAVFQSTVRATSVTISRFSFGTRRTNWPTWPRTKCPSFISHRLAVRQGTAELRPAIFQEFSPTFTNGTVSRNISLIETRGSYIGGDSHSTGRDIGTRAAPCQEILSFRSNRGRCALQAVHTEAVCKPIMRLRVRLNQSEIGRRQPHLTA
jgi:hypothetical protein